MSGRKMVPHDSKSNLALIKYIVQKSFLTFFFLISNGDVTVIIGGETDGIVDGAVDTVETYSPDCGLFNANIPPIPVARKLLAATYLDGL